MTRNGIATVEKMVLSVTQPMAKKAMPSMSAMVVRLRLFNFMNCYFLLIEECRGDPSMCVVNTSM